MEAECTQCKKLKKIINKVIGLCNNCYQREYRKANRARLNLQDKARRTANPEPYREKSRRYNSSDKGKARRKLRLGSG